MKTIKRTGGLVPSGEKIQSRICLGIPMTGLLRSEWVLSRYGQIIPVNWANAELIQWFDSFSPLSFAVDHARNLCVQHVVQNDFEWLLFIDHDVILPQDTFVKMNEYMLKGKYPVVAGLYAAKGNPPEPLLFRGTGNSYYKDWKRGDKVWVDGIPMGCTLISTKLLKPMYEASEEYVAPGNVKTRRVFHSPRGSVFNTKTGRFNPYQGTEDLWWCQRVIKEGWLAKAGFKEVAKKEYPFLVDTNIWCGHINPDGLMFWPPEPKKK